jgi:hypothetical protein
MVSSHLSTKCSKKEGHWYRLSDSLFASLIKENFPVHRVHDWTPEETDAISSVFCPLTEEQAQSLQEFVHECMPDM